MYLPPAEFIIKQITKSCQGNGQADRIRQRKYGEKRYMKKTIRMYVAAMFAMIICIMMFPQVFRSAHAAMAAVELDRTSVVLMKGSSTTLNVTGTKKKVTWVSGNKKIAKIDENGTVTGVSKGSCKVMAKVGSKKLKCSVTVKTMKNVNTVGALKGIDVSVWQGTIDFEKVKEDGIEFVIIRAGYARTADVNFKKNYKNARKNGLLIGTYWYSTSLSHSESVAQVKQYLKTIKGLEFDLPVFVDFESSSQFRKGKNFCSGMVTTFCDRIEDAGYEPGWYTSRSFIQNYLTDKVARNSGYSAWIAEHNPTLKYSYPCDFWQFSSTGRIKGIKSYVDLDWYFPNAYSK